MHSSAHLKSPKPSSRTWTSVLSRTLVSLCHMFSVRAQRMCCRAGLKRVTFMASHPSSSRLPTSELLLALRFRIQASLSHAMLIFVVFSSSHAPNLFAEWLKQRPRLLPVLVVSGGAIRLRSKNGATREFHTNLWGICSDTRFLNYPCSTTLLL
jgi:hypothetical protein